MDVWMKEGDSCSPSLLKELGEGASVELSEIGRRMPRHLQKTRTSNWTEEEKRAVKEWIVEEERRGGLIRVQQVPWITTPVFPLPKKEKGAWRVVHNLKALNERCVHAAFKMDGMKDVLKAWNDMQFAITFDLKDAFKHMAIKEEDREMFGLEFEGASHQDTTH